MKICNSFPRIKKQPVTANVRKYYRKIEVLNIISNVYACMICNNKFIVYMQIIK